MKKIIFEKLILLILLALVLLLITNDLSAQFTFDGQLIQRTEVRNGYGKISANGADPAAFISQRLRLQFKYSHKRLTMYSSLQDVRTWGNTSQIKLNDPFLSLHEAWGEIKMDTNWSIKLGRQELVYDNSRFLGNLDWALQGRAHDFALLKFEKGEHKLHIGGGYNQDSEGLLGNLFNTANQYKTAQMLWYEMKLKSFAMSFFVWNDGRQFSIKDTSGKVLRKGVRFMPTIGLPTISYTHKNVQISGFYYHQLGTNAAGKKMNAFDANIQFSGKLKINESKKSNFVATLGAEVLSGTNSNNTSNSSFSYTPLYGTNHSFNGYMDMFYVGGRHENSVGLIDGFLRLKYEINANLFISLNTHYFNSYAKIYQGTNLMKQYLGTELDLTAGYKMNNGVSLQFGYSQMLAGNSLKTIQNVANANSYQGWMYLMFIYRPTSNKKFIGLLF